jgi:hypothetical protein
LIKHPANSLSLRTGLALALLLGVDSGARAAEFPLWATPQATEYAAGESFRQKLSQPQEFLREGLTRREALVRTSESTGVAIWLDRRLDPSVERAWRTTGEPLEAAIGRHLAPEKAATGRCGDVLYVGLPKVAERVEAYSELRRAEATKAPGTRPKRLAEKKPFGWEPASEPRAILEQIGAAFELEIQGLDQIPQDLWPGAALPDADAATQLSLVLAPFDKTFAWRNSGTAIEIGSMDGNDEGLTAINGRLAASIAPTTWAERFPQVKFERTDGILYAQGPWAELVRVSRLATGDKTPRTIPAAGPGEKRYTLRVQNEMAGSVVKKMAELLGLEVQFPQDLIERLKSRVTLDAVEVERDDLLRQTLHPVGVEFQIEGTALILSEREAP